MFIRPSGIRGICCVVVIENGLNREIPYRHYIRAIERNADVLLNACKDIGLAVNPGKTKYKEIGRHRGMIANEHIKMGRNSYEKVKFV